MLYVDQSLCTGCLRCAKIAPDVFIIKNGKAQIISDGAVEASPAVKNAICGCPVCAIKERSEK